MPDISGLEFVTSLQKKPMVIFTTAYSEHAVTSFELDAVDYLLKPVVPSRLGEAIARVRQRGLLPLRPPHPTKTGPG